MQKYIFGNWKMYNNWEKTERFVKTFNAFYQQNSSLLSELVYGLALPSLYLLPFQNLNQAATLKLAAQHLSGFTKGPYTGQMSAAMLAEAKIKYTLVGHSERRQLNFETNQNVRLQIEQALNHKIMPIICIGETLKENEQNLRYEVIKKQLLSATKNLDAKTYLIAYEPIWAIGTGKTMEPQEAQKVAAYIHQLVDEKVKVLYGGSVSPENIKAYLEQKDISGALVGGASLEAKSFINLLKPFLKGTINGSF